MSVFNRIVAAMRPTALAINGETITFLPASSVSDPVDVSAVWNDDEANLPQGVRATAWLAEADLGGVKPAKNDTVRRGAFTYRLVDPPNGVAAQRDGMGGVTLYLRQIAHAPDA